MIECCEEKIYNKKNRRHKKRRFFPFLILIISVSIFIWWKYVASLQVYNICADYSYAASMDAVNKAVMTSLSDGLKYADLVQVEKNTSGDIILIKTDSLQINKFNREIAIKTNENMSDIISGGVPIPALSFSGISILSGYGATIDYQVVNVTGVTCDFLSDFKSVGINQTLHSLYACVICTINIELPLNHKSMECKSNILISESVLVGKVPDVYLNGNLKSV